MGALTEPVCVDKSLKAMANHKSSEKRARQSVKRTERNRAVRAKVRTMTNKAADAPSDKTKEALSEAYSAIQKSRGVYHRNTVKRKMSRLAKAVARKAKQA